MWEEFGETMENDFQLAPLRFWQTVRRFRREKQWFTNTVCSRGGVLLTLTGDIVWRWKEYLEELLNPTNTSSREDAEPVDPGWTSSLRLWMLLDCLG